MDQWVWKLNFLPMRFPGFSEMTRFPRNNSVLWQFNVSFAVGHEPSSHWSKPSQNRKLLASPWEHPGWLSHMAKLWHVSDNDLYKSMWIQGFVDKLHPFTIFYPMNHLVGGLEHDFYFSTYWEFHHPSWLSLIFFRGVGFNHQPVRFCCIFSG